jgi:hypothetical protein
VSDERQQFRLLTRHFFGGFLDNDLMSPVSDMHGPLSKAVAMIGVIGFLYPFKLLFTYGRIFLDYAVLDRLSWGDKGTFVTLSLVLMGLLTVLEWDALQLDRRDCRALGALPIRARTILSAKLAALGQFVLVLSVPLALAGALTFPPIMHAGWRSGWAVVLRTVAGHGVATLAAAWWVFFSLLAAQSLIQVVFGQRLARRMSAAVQLLATLGFVVALLMLSFIVSHTAVLKQGAAATGGLAPQLWFLGIYQCIAGQGDADWALLAMRGWWALVASTAVGVGASLIAYRRVLGTTLETVQGGGGRSVIAPLVAAVGRVIAWHPAERGFYAFTVQTILRSPWHRVVLAVFFGGALALSMVTLDLATYARDGVRRMPMLVSHALAMQFVILAIVIAGVRTAASAPAELRAVWVLRMLEGDDSHRWMAGFRKAVFVILIVPVVALMALAMAVQYDGRTAWTLGLAALGVAGVTFEVAFLGFGRVPFACPIAGESGDPSIRGPLTVALFTVLVVPIAQLVTIALRSGTGAAIALAVLLGLLAVLRWRSRVAIARGGGLSFEPEDQTTQALGLGP